MGDNPQPEAEALPSLVSDSQREVVLGHLRGLVGDNSLELSTFERLAGQALAARTSEDLASVMRQAPPAFAMTPPSHRLGEPLTLGTRTGHLKMDGRWQVGATTRVEVHTGAVVLDMTNAEFDSLVIDLRPRRFRFWRRRSQRR